MWFKKKSNAPKPNGFDFNFRLTIRSLIMFEALAKKKFSDTLEEADMILLMYSAFVCSTGMRMSVKAFGNLMENDRFARKFASCMRETQDFIDQFSDSEVSSNIEHGENAEQSGNTKEALSITDMANTLIFKYGIDVNYVMKDMELWELKDFLKGAEEQYKEDMEDKRFWTFMQVAPNIDLKKCKTPDKYLPFAWEKNEKARKAKEGLEKEEERAKATIGMTF